MNLLFEDMIRVETDKYICRIWRQWEGESHLDSDRVKQMATLILEDGSFDSSEAATAIIGVEYVNSVEVVDRATGCGVCVHKDWP